MCVPLCCCLPRSSILHAAEECANCHLPHGVTFNATGFIRTVSALSCSATYNPTIVARDSGTKRAFGAGGGHRSIAAPRRPDAGRRLLSADAADYEGRESQGNSTVYEGVATIIEADITHTFSHNNYAGAWLSPVLISPAFGLLLRELVKGWHALFELPKIVVTGVTCWGRYTCTERMAGVAGRSCNIPGRSTR